MKPQPDSSSIPNKQTFASWKKEYSKTDEFLVGDVWEVAEAAWNAAKGTLRALEAENAALRRKYEGLVQELVDPL